MKIILISLLILSVVSCKKDEDTKPKEPEFTIVGTWEMGLWKFTLTPDGRYDYLSLSEWRYTKGQPYNILIINTEAPHWLRTRLEVVEVDYYTFKDSKGNTYKRVK